MCFKEGGEGRARREGRAGQGAGAACAATAREIQSAAEYIFCMHNRVPHLTEDQAVPCQLFMHFLLEVFRAPTSSEKANRLRTQGKQC